MKSSLFTLPIAIAAIISSLCSCQKEAPLQASAPPSAVHPFKINLVADSWIRYNWSTPCDPQDTHFGECPNTGHPDTHIVYVSTLQDALSPADLDCHCTIKIYLVANNSDSQISDSPIMFMGNELRASVMQSNVQLTYTSAASTLPFSSLNIRVVGE